MSMSNQKVKRSRFSVYTVYQNVFVCMSTWDLGKTQSWDKDNVKCPQYRTWFYHVCLYSCLYRYWVSDSLWLGRWVVELSKCHWGGVWRESAVLRKFVDHLSIISYHRYMTQCMDVLDYRWVLSRRDCLDFKPIKCRLWWNTNKLILNDSRLSVSFNYDIRSYLYHRTKNFKRKPLLKT